ncbi:RNA polymerase sigma-70 factor, ECF subfamily [Marininema halotolerans]|uniref:RNA polymerase sigma-70 factor, ECF subfamily n=1 Tax=Marininema halotolerans TaxID=1155944 RepID=A0A1I6TP31_9BACL|nr:RNA polymerase sigma-70 factor, ECF subfamily [Marininema halotolerans]
MFSIAYQMLGTVSDAEDMVQDTFLALSRVPSERITHWKAYLCKSLTNRCLDRLKSASSQREQYIGPWLPEPIVTEAGPEEVTLQHDHLSLAYLHLLERLSPIERIAFVLREALGLDYPQIAEMMGKTTANCRKLVSRAKGKMEQKITTKAPGPNRETLPFFKQFLDALYKGDAQQLTHLLAEEPSLYSDGGGKARAALRPLFGQQRITAFLLGINNKMTKPFNVTLVNVNGQPGILKQSDDGIDWIMTCHWENHQIKDLYFYLNPDKMKHIFSSYEVTGTTITIQ